MRKRLYISTGLVSAVLLLTVSSLLAQNLLNQPESVVFDTTVYRYLVSNTGDGKIIQYTNATTQSVFNSDQVSIRGLHIMGDTLYAACNEGVVGFDLATGVKVLTVSINEPKYLNDITSDNDKNLYVSNSDAGKIYKVDPVALTYSTLASGLTSPNGLFYDQLKSKLLVAQWGSNALIYNVRLPDGAVGVAVNTGFSNLDGLAEDKAGRIYVSSWGSNKVYRYDRDFNEAPEEVSSGHNGPADIFMNKLTGNLVIPNYNSNTIDFVMVETIIIDSDSIVVTNTKDTGTGSLRNALDLANSLAYLGPDTITFDIPALDPNYNTNTGVWTISPQSLLPALESGSTFIDGISQGENQGDTNSDGLEIVIDGSQVTGDGFTITSDNNKIRGLNIHSFSGSGIHITGTSAELNSIQENLLGTDEDGLTGKPNGIGVHISSGASNNEIGIRHKGNLISGNSNCGIKITGSGTSMNSVKSCFIGVDMTMNSSLGNKYNGIEISYGAQNNIIGGTEVGNANIISGTVTSSTVYSGNGIIILEAHRNEVYGNLIGAGGINDESLGNKSVGVCILRADENIIGGSGDFAHNIIQGNGNVGILVRTGSDNIITGNYIGTDYTKTMSVGNDRDGILLDYGSKNNIIGPGNIIAYNGMNGVQVEHDSTTGNTITQNSIKGNGGMGINNVNGGNGELAPPVLTEAAADHVNGDAPAGLTVELFSDSLDEGGVYQHTVKSKSPGKFTSTVTYEGPNVTATVTDSEGNTSEFSNPLTTDVPPKEQNAAPGAFFLSQNFPNPFNPVTEIQYTIPVKGDVTITIFNTVGKKIVTLINRFHSAGKYSICWNGKDTSGNRVSSGVYLYKIQIEKYKDVKKLILAK